jgi:hypothetical protein
MVALTALMRKIVVIANAKMRDWYKCKGNTGEITGISATQLSV